MSYSDSDFVDEVLDAFINHKLIQKHKLSTNDLSIKADRVLDALDKLVRQRDQMIAALQSGLTLAENAIPEHKKADRARIAKLLRTAITRTGLPTAQ